MQQSKNKQKSLHKFFQYAAPLALPSLLAINSNAADCDDLTLLSLEDLMAIEVTSVSKKPQKLTDTAAAAFVINQEDIRRSGARHIPDLLRMVPGVQVARIDANKWAVSIRGFMGRFANKLLVLKDGISVYTPLYSGVFWELEDTPLEDIERIEVIRGPGAALWGANAVNGVINIITKSAHDTKGGFLSAGSGSQNPGFGTVRYGLGLNENSSLRMYGRYSNNGAGRALNGGDSHDEWQSCSAGFRLDSQLSDTDRLTFQGDYFAGSYDETFTVYNLDNPGVADVKPTHSTTNGFKLLGRWQHELDGGDNLSLQAYFDHYHYSMLELGETRNTADLEFQHKISIGNYNELIWGLGYRFSHDQLTNSEYIAFDKTSKSTNLFSMFLHDEITLLPEQLSLILGARLEHNTYSGFEIQPNARLRWTPTEGHSFWAAVSRAVRTPSRGDDGLNYRFRTLPAGTLDPTVPLPTRLEINGNSNFKSEEVIAYELGYRTKPTSNTSFDLSLFFNQYDKLRIPNIGDPVVADDFTHVTIPNKLSNSMHGHTYGVEFSGNWQPFDWWRMQAVYSYLRSKMRLNHYAGGDPLGLREINRADVADGSPRHQGSLRSSFDLGKQVELDFWLRMVDRVRYVDGNQMPGYVTMDTRIAWKPTKQWELALVGQNLFQKHHQEYQPEFINTSPSKVPRSVYGKVTWKF